MTLSLAHQERKDIPKTLVVGVTELPPFSMKAADGKWEGVGIDLLRQATVELGLGFKTKEFHRIKQITEALNKNEIDLTCAVAVTESNEIVMDLSHSYYRSGLGIVVRKANQGFSWADYARRTPWKDVCAAIGMLLILSLLSGTMIWLREKRGNPAMFGERVGQGIGHGLWWALVTMTTVGYGDKAPQSVGGRAVAVVWMFLSVFCIAGYTAVITSSLTVSQLSGRVRGFHDLPGARVGALSKSETMDFLTLEGIYAKPFEDLKVGLQALKDNKIDAFVDDVSQIKYLVQSYFPGNLQVLAETFEHYYVSMGLTIESPFREPLNRAIAKFINKKDWSQLKMRYMGSTR